MYKVKSLFPILAAAYEDNCEMVQVVRYNRLLKSKKYTQFRFKNLSFQKKI